jgi:hypothetical protein
MSATRRRRHGVVPAAGAVVINVIACSPYRRFDTLVGTAIALHHIVVDAHDLSGLAGFRESCSVETSEVNYEAPLPPYRQVAADIIRAVESGELGVGARVPTESVLMGTYGIARNTPRNVVEYLRKEGWVRTVPQRGTYVLERGE